MTSDERFDAWWRIFRGVESPLTAAKAAWQEQEKQIAELESKLQIAVEALDVAHDYVQAAVIQRKETYAGYPRRANMDDEWLALVENAIDKIKGEVK